MPGHTQCRRRSPNVAVNCHSRMELRRPTARKSHPNFFAHCKRSTKRGQAIRSAAPLTQNHLSKPDDLMLQNVTPSGNQRPDLLTALMNMSLVLRLSRKIHLCRSSSNVPRLPSFLKMLQNPHVLLTFGNTLGLPRETTSERPKVLCTPQSFALLTSKCVSRHNSVHFFDTATSKSATKLKCFVHFHLEMCFTPQRHALFRHRISKVL